MGYKDAEKGKYEDYETKIAEFVKTQETEDTIREKCSYFYRQAIECLKNDLDLDKEKFSKAIEFFQMAQDARNGIVTSIIDSPIKNGLKLRVRDVTQHNETFTAEASKNNTKDEYIIRCVNVARAAINLIDNSKIDNSKSLKEIEADKVIAKQKILKDLTLQTTALVSFGKNSDKEFTGLMLDHLKKAGLEPQVASGEEYSLLKQLNIAKDFSCFEVETCHTATIGKDGNVTTQYAITEQAPELDIFYKEAKKLIDGEVGPYDKVVSAWVDSLPEFKKQLFLKNYEAIIDGKHMFSAQLIDDLPGLRNAYETVTYNHDTQGKLEKTSSNVHCGAPVFTGKGGKKITKWIIKDLSTKFGTINLNSFISPMMIIRRDENKIHNNMKAAVKELDKERAEGGNLDVPSVTLSLLPFNFARRFMSNDTKAIETKLKEFKVDKILEDAEGKLKESPNNEVLRKALNDAKENIKNAPKNYELANAHAARLEGLIKDSKSFGSLFSGRNYNLEIALEEDMLRKYAKKIFSDPAIPLKPPVEINFCKSGKDRTGIFRVALEAYRRMEEEVIKTEEAAEYIKNLKDSKNTLDKLGNGSIKKHITEVINEGLVGATAGYSGGTFGASGVKKDSISAIPAELEKELSFVVEESASENKLEKPKKSDSKNKLEVEELSLMKKIKNMFEKNEVANAISKYIYEKNPMNGTPQTSLSSSLSNSVISESQEVASSEKSFPNNLLDADTRKNIEDLKIELEPAEGDDHESPPKLLTPGGGAQRPQRGRSNSL